MRQPHVVHNREVKSALMDDGKDDSGVYLACIQPSGTRIHAENALGDR